MRTWLSSPAGPFSHRIAKVEMRLPLLMVGGAGRSEEGGGGTEPTTAAPSARICAYFNALIRRN